MLAMLETITELSWGVWLVLGLCAYAVVTAVLSILAARVRDELERHELAVRAVEQRHSYKRSVQEARDRAAEAAEQERAKRRAKAQKRAAA